MRAERLDCIPALVGTCMATAIYNQLYCLIVPELTTQASYQPNGNPFTPFVLKKGCMKGWINKIYNISTCDHVVM